MLDKFVSKKDMIIFTGVGKSGHIARLFNASMQSIGFNSNYLDITDALHGDVGIFYNKNIKLIAISKSGESIELESLFKHLKKNNKVKILLMTSVKKSYLSIYADFVELISYKSEGNNLDLPSKSLSSYVENFYKSFNKLINNKKYTLGAIGFSHPNGKIGRVMRKVKYYANKKIDDFVLNISEASIEKIVSKMTKNKTGSLVILKNKKLENIITDGDIRRNGLTEKLIFFAKRKREVFYVSEDDSIQQALEIMKKNKVSFLPVVTKGMILKSIITLQDII